MYCIDEHQTFSRIAFVHPVFCKPLFSEKVSSLKIVIIIMFQFSFENSSFFSFSGYFL